ncbi:MAG TPA: hypothetical protein VNW97_13615 [Candidatus Saccharimonadales bacterium]|nr:hypothetical protein [Candidatus Saccharimonadales bacterium]
MRYEEIRRKLVLLFIRRSSNCSEELADETIDRVARKNADSKVLDYQGDPILYFYGVARNVFHEYLDRERTRARRLQEIPPFPAIISEQEFQCLDQCLAKLDTPSRNLITSYHQHQGKKKITGRQALANQMGINMNSLRIQAWRIRNTLRECVVDCVHSVDAQEFDGPSGGPMLRGNDARE